MRFVVHRPGNPVASPRSHGEPRRDVPSRVHVSVAGETAGRTYEARLALARLRIHVPAHRAALTAERGTDLLHSAGRLVHQPMHHQSPTRPQDLTIESCLGKDIPARCVDGSSRRARHLADLEILDPNQVESARDVGARLFGPVLTPVRLASAHPGDGQPQSVATVRSQASASEPTFQVMKPLTLLRGQTGSMQQLASRQGRRYYDAPVNAYGHVVTRRRNRLGNYGEGDMPAPGPVTRHSVRPHVSRHDTGPAETHPSGLRYRDIRTH